MGFESCHPAVNFLFFAAVIYGSVAFQHPVFLAISCLCAFAFSMKRNGKRAVIFNLCLLPLVVCFALYYSSYHHFGVTVLKQNFIGNNLTVESFVYGMVTGLRAAAVCMWLSCLFRVVSSDKVLYLFGRVSPRLSLFLTILLRFIPRIGREARKINLAQKGIGRGSNQGNLFRRLVNCLRMFSTDLLRHHRRPVRQGAAGPEPVPQRPARRGRHAQGPVPAEPGGGRSAVPGGAAGHLPDGAAPG